MITPSAVGECKLLLGYVDKVYVIYVNDKAASDSEEVASLFAKLLADHAFELAKLECYQTLPVVDGDYIGVVSF